MRDTKSIIRLFVETELRQDGQVVLDREQTHYLVNVMRRAVGDQVLAFNGKDGEWRAELSEASKKSSTITCIEQTRPQTTEPDLWLVFAPIKRARLDFIAQKATELGVSGLLPVMTRRTIATRIKGERMEANAAEAAEQCERLTVPECFEAKKFDALIRDWDTDRHILFCDESLTGMPAHDELREKFTKGKPGKWAIFIGPEGGFDEAERKAILNLPNVTTVTLGPRLLRADTAAMAAITLWQSALGDW